MDDSLRLRPGWEVVRASTLLEAIRAAGDSRFDAAVLETELPDGSGIDILDFLRIGSPNIHILLLSETANESVAFHALSHGAGDLLVKNPHLDQELPRRISAMLDQPEPMGALVETLSAVRHYDALTRAAASPAQQSSDIEKTLGGIVTGNVIAAGVWDLRGRPVAIKLPADMDADGIGFAMATMHGQIGALWTYGNMKPTGYHLVVDVEGGILAITAIPGTFIVALLFETGITPKRAMEKTEAAGMLILAALHGGRSGNDVAAP